METEFWEYSKKLYSKVSHSFIWLQDFRGLDVNLLLFCCWRGQLGQLFSPTDIRLFCDKVSGIRQNFILPIREARKYLPKIEWSIKSKNLKKKLLAIELEGERIEQTILVNSLGSIKKGSPEVNSRAAKLVNANIISYLEHHNVVIDSEVREELSAITCSIFPKRFRTKTTKIVAVSII